MLFKNSTSEKRGQQERNWAMLCHLSALAGYVFPFGNLVGPLFVWLSKRAEFPLVADQGRESLNFQISVTIYTLCAFALVFFFFPTGILILIALVVLNFIAVIVAAVRANGGEHYRYPLAMRFVE